MSDDTLARCPCGATPNELLVLDTGQSGKWALVYGACCGEWHVEFRADYHAPGSAECMTRARAAWNAAPRVIS